MFHKVLIAADKASSALDLYQTLPKNPLIGKVLKVKFYDDAMLKFWAARAKGSPFDLLITDLYFTSTRDYQKLTSGEELIEAIRLFDTDIRIIVVSEKKQLCFIQKLFNKYHINGFLVKDSYELVELTNAIKTIASGLNYAPPTLPKLKNSSNLQEITEYQICLIRLVARCDKIEDVAAHLKKNNIKPYAQRTVEDRLSKLKDIFNVKTTIQLVLAAKEQGLI